MMRLTVTVPDEIGQEVKKRTDNVSAYVTAALEERLRIEKRDEARRKLLDLAGRSGRSREEVREAIEFLHKERRESDRF